MGAVYNFPGILYLVISKCEEGVGFRGKVIKRYNCSEGPRSFNANGNYKGEGRFIGL